MFQQTRVRTELDLSEDLRSIIKPIEQNELLVKVGDIYVCLETKAGLLIARCLVIGHIHRAVSSCTHALGIHYPSLVFSDSILCILSLIALSF
jgi:hypothetical protein